MKFDVVVMNPPYQMEDGGFARSSMPIYHLFIEQAIDELSPNYLLCVCPSRWMFGGKGLDKFRQRMMNDTRIKTVDHFPTVYDIFPGVDIQGGVSYLLWDKDHDGPCRFSDGHTTTDRRLSEFDLVVLENMGIPILKKVRSQCRRWLNEKCLSSKPFGLRTNFNDWTVAGVPCYTKGSKKCHVAADAFTDREGAIGKWKVLLGGVLHRATREGEVPDGSLRKSLCGVKVIEPGAICTETYLVVNTFDNKREAENFAVYMKTKFFRFMLGLRARTQNVTQDRFAWVPDLDYSKPCTDKELYEMFSLDEAEQQYIENKIKEMSP